MTATRWTRWEAFAETLRPSVMGPRLAVATGTGPPVCHVLDAKYEPGSRAVVLYAHDGRLLRGDLLPVDDRGREPARDAPCFLVLPGLRVLPFPHDPDLPGLARVMDPARLGPVLGPMPHAGHAGKAHVGLVDRAHAHRCRVRLLRYRPGRRATVLLTWGAGAPAHVGKVYHDVAKAAAVAEEAEALAAATSSRGMLRLARPAAHVPELGLVVHDHVPGGTPLGALLAHPRHVPARARPAVRRAARALAELHAAPVVSTRSRPVGRELQRFAQRAAGVAEVDPPLSRELGRLARRLTQAHTALPARQDGLVHGDCTPGQFLLRGPHVYLLDLDHCGMSDPATDVGTFLASLRQLAVRHGLARCPPGHAEAMDRLGEEFLEAYVDSRGDDASLVVRARWHEAAALERKALRAFARAPGAPLAGALTAEAHRRLDRLRAGT
jgi:aminoglycoside phosphotransferase (APT) family kinase protein